MSLAPNALTTIDAVKSDLGILDGSQDAVIERMINGASDAIERYCRRKFGRAIVLNEKLESTYGQKILAKITPLVSVESVTVNDVAIDANEIEIEDALAGVVVRKTLAFGGITVASSGSIARDIVWGIEPLTIKISYTGGYLLPPDAGANLPASIQEACISTACAMYRKRGRDSSIASEALGDASVSYRGVSVASGIGSAGVIPDDVLGLLAPFVRVV